jgi:hypothetical protein
MLSFENTWLPFIYLYGVGGFFFIIGIIITLKSGALDLKKKKHKFWFRVIIFGFLWFAAIHFILNIAALYW